MNIDWYNTARVVHTIPGETPHLASILTIQDCMAALEENLQRQDLNAIINDKELFWLAFCKALHPLQISENARWFSVAISGTTLTVVGREHMIREIRQVLERLRHHVAMHQKEHSEFTMLSLETPTLSYLFTERTYVDTYEEEDSQTHWFAKHVLPALPALTAILGITLTQKKKSILVKYVRELPASEREVTELQFSWQEAVHLVYPITPKKIEHRGPTDKAIYDLYLAQKRCDYELLTKRDKVLKAHSLMLFLYSGNLAPVFEAGMRETHQGKIDLSRYSEKTLKAFLDYVYLGPSAFFDKFNKEGTKFANLFKIFDLANQWQITPLIDTCTNLISLHVGKEHKERVQHAAEQHNNAHLRELLTLFAKQNKRKRDEIDPPTN